MISGAQSETVCVGRVNNVIVILLLCLLRRVERNCRLCQYVWCTETTDKSVFRKWPPPRSPSDTATAMWYRSMRTRLALVNVWCNQSSPSSGLRPCRAPITTACPNSRLERGLCVHYTFNGDNLDHIKQANKIMEAVPVRERGGDCSG